MEHETEILSVLNDMKLLLREINYKTKTLTNSSMVKNYDTSVTTEKQFNAHELLGLPNNIKILSISVLDIGGGLTIRINGDDRAITMVNGSTFTDEIIETVSFVGGGAGTAYVRFGFYIPKYFNEVI